jgi:CheY-like chemotaxis protein
LNLISNGIKFTAHGFVRVGIDVSATTGSVVSLRFRVSDSGVGIEETQQKLIFEAFRQADGSTTRKHGGTGLGLAICSRLVNMMGGELSVVSRPGEGSSFTFTARFHVAAVVPVRTNELTTGIRKLAGAVKNGGTRPMRVLVAEDNAVNQRVLVRLLEKQGHDVEVALNGKQALEMTLRRHFDLVLMDVQMPEMDGLETTRQIRALEAESGRRLPILILTANAMSGDKEKCLDAGADGYLAKPVSLKMLVQAIEDLHAQSKRM